MCLVALLWLLAGCVDRFGTTNSADRFDSEQQLVSAFNEAYENRDGDAAGSLFCNGDGTQALFEQLWEPMGVAHVFPGDGLSPEQRPAAGITDIEYTIGDGTSSGPQVEFNLETDSGSQRVLALAVQRDGGWVFCG